MRYIILALLALVTAGGAHSATQEKALDAKTSDAKIQGWMSGFPPLAKKTIRFTDADYFSFPKLRWTVCHFRELMPTVGVNRGTAAARPFEVALDGAIDSLTFVPLGQDTPMTWGQAYDANFSDGLIVLHHGRIVYERYSSCLDEAGQHGAMSVTKSITGLLGEVLVAEGVLDEQARIADLVPELASSAFGDATVQQLLEMTTALDYSEDYSNPKAEVWAYAQAGSPLPKPKRYSGPRSYFEFLETVKKKGEHGTAFGYKTVNADALGWVIARVTGQSVAELFSERIWQYIGADREAYFTVDSVGTPFAGGGFNASLRDMARLGQLLLDDGQIDGRQLIPQAAIARIRQGGNPEKFAKAGYDLASWSYRGMWWVTDDDHGAYTARGVHGQTLWIDPTADMVIARFASNPVAANAANDPTSLPAYRAIADYLMTTDQQDVLTAGEWLIEDIAGGGVIKNSQASLMFSAEGQLAGNASCNRLIGSYSLDGDAVSFELLGSTMMLCADADMQQEKLLLDMLPLIKHYSIDNTGALKLTTADGSTLTARRL